MNEQVAVEVREKESKGAKFPEIAPVSLYNFAFHRAPRSCSRTCLLDRTQKDRNLRINSFSFAKQLVSGLRGKKVYEDGDSDAGVWSCSPVV